MALINAGGETLQTKLPKVMSPTAHGVIDYVLRESGRSVVHAPADGKPKF
jgi:hypothetical protein